MIYCIEVWGNASSIHIHPLIKLQKNIRIIICLKYTPDKTMYTLPQAYSQSMSY